MATDSRLAVFNDETCCDYDLEARPRPQVGDQPPRDWQLYRFPDADRQKAFREHWEHDLEMRVHLGVTLTHRSAKYGF
jgi:hypothetical protein